MRKTTVLWLIVGALLVVGWHVNKLRVQHALVSMNDVAVNHLTAGDYDAAQRAFEKALSRGRLLGSDHPQILTLRANLAHSLIKKGAIYQAGRMEAEILEIRRRVLGTEHPDTLISMSNLSDTLNKQGRLEHSRKIAEEALAIRRRTAGTEHADTLISLGNLANILSQQGSYERAQEIEEEVLTVRRRILGNEHPDTLTAMSNLADTLRQRGEFNNARRIEEQALAIRRRTAGAEHPDTSRARLNLAQTLKKQGDLELAGSMEIETLAIQRRTLGAAHPDTLTTMANLANTLSSQGHLERARELAQEVLAIRRQSRGTEHPETLTAMNNLATILWQQRDFETSRQIFEEILTIHRRVAGEAHPDTLTALANLAQALSENGDLEQAMEMEREVWTTRRRILGDEHPDTLTAMANLASSLTRQGNYEGARKLEAQILEARRRILGAEHPATLKSLANLAHSLAKQGHAGQARRTFEQALAIHRRVLGVEHPETLTVMSNLAGTIQMLGDLERAREMEEKVLDIRRRVLGIEHPDTLWSLGNLANTLHEQSDLERARAIEEELLATRRRVLGTEHPDTLTSMLNLASTARAQGDLEDAERLEEETVARRRKSSGAEHPDTLTAMNNLAGSLQEQGELERAREIFEEILAIQSRVLGAEHPDTLTSTHNLAALLYEMKDLKRAQALLEHFLRARMTAAGGDYQPATEQDLNNLLYLADVCRELEDLDKAYRFDLQALAALERQTRKKGASGRIRGGFKARYESAYRDALETALALDRSEEAHHVLERFRAQELLRMFAERGEAFAVLPADLETRRVEIDREYDAATWRRDRLDPVRDREAFAATLERQRDLRRQRELLQAEIGRRSPEPAAVQDHRPLTVAEIRNALDPGTSMLSYMVGPKWTTLFVIARDRELETHRLDVGEAALWLQLQRFYGSLAMVPEPDSGTSGLSGWLYRKIFAPAARTIDRSDRLLVVADGPLHYLPFATLTGPDGGPLVEKIAVHTVASATVYAHLQRRRERATTSRALEVVAFGDPSYPDNGARDDVTVRSAMERGLLQGGLQPLPFTEHEVNEIGKLFPETSQTFLREEATEENARAAGMVSRILHVAAHGVMDRFTPLDSFIALAIPEDVDGTVAAGGHNGLLQAWELFERVRFDADLVVLSACVTALGEERAGEGLLSLTRAFQVAGARTIVASLWNVADESTAELMIRFYTHLRDGKSIDEALRAAQLSFVRGEGVPEAWRAPYHWAAFRVIGDWR